MNRHRFRWFITAGFALAGLVCSCANHEGALAAHAGAGGATSGEAGAPGGVRGGASSAGTISSGGFGGTSAMSGAMGGAGTGLGRAAGAGGALSGVAGRGVAGQPGTGASPNGGTSGATGASGADGGMTCPLPTKFKWTSSGPLIAPKAVAGHNFVSLKDSTVVEFNNLFHVYATVSDSGHDGWAMVYFNFSDWSQAGQASQYYMPNSPVGVKCAPQIFYFTPKKKWVLTYQWGAQFSTADDLSKPETWTRPTSLLNGGPSGGIDYTVICNSENCYLFFAGDNGKLYQSKLAIAQFPGTFNGYTTIMSDTTNNLFEAPQLYAIKGTGEYLLIVEAIGSGGRYFRSWTATSLDGPWKALAATEQNPFAGKANVTFGGSAWTNDISHGDMVRNNPDETMTIDACNMQFLYQGYDPHASFQGYENTPYRLGLITLSR
jgi:hypothetical protein